MFRYYFSESNKNQYLFFFWSELKIVKDVFNLILNYQLNKLNLQSFQDFDIDSSNQISCYNNINAQILLFIRIYLLLFMRAHLCSKIKGRTKKQKYIKTLKLTSKRFILVQDNILYHYHNITLYKARFAMTNFRGKIFLSNDHSISKLDHNLLNHSLY